MTFQFIMAMEYTCAVLGSGGVGKTCMILRLTQDRFDPEYVPTIQDYFEKKITFDGSEYTLKITDTAGQDEMAGITDIGIKDAQACVIVYSVSSQVTFRECEKFREKVQQLSLNGETHIVLCGNKCDVEDRAVTKKEGEDLARKWGVDFFETSAKEGINITQSFEAVLKCLLPNQKKGKKQSQGGGGNEKSGCCEVA